MNIEEIDKLFLDAGFERIEDPIFFWELKLVDKELVAPNFNKDYIPTILYGDNGLYNGLCLHVNNCYIWLNITNPKEAVEFTNNLKAVEYIDY